MENSQEDGKRTRDMKDEMENERQSEGEMERRRREERDG